MSRFCDNITAMEGGLVISNTAGEATDILPTTYRHALQGHVMASSLSW